MIRGRFLTLGGIRRSFVEAALTFPRLHERAYFVRLLVDTGADRTILAPLDAIRLERELGMSLATLPAGPLGTGVGGSTPTRVIRAAATFGSHTTGEFALTALERAAGPIPRIPSLLGRDLLQQFGLFLEERTLRVFLLEPEEVDRLSLPD